jgi:hypothetical protein
MKLGQISSNTLMILYNTLKICLQNIFWFEQNFVLFHVVNE